MTNTPQGEQIEVHVDPTDVMGAFAKHRRRFAAEMSELDAAALAHPSRCTEWSNADVLRHSCDVDGWMQGIWTRAPVPFNSFDPRTTPHEFVLKRRDVPDLQVRDLYVESSEAMAADVAASSSERYGEPSLSPVGFVPWWLSALHAFYDSWLHERDVLLPLGISPPVEPDESLAVLAYSLALAGTFVDGPFDDVVSGVRVRKGDGPVTVTPMTPEPDADIIDALSGRGNVDLIDARLSRFGSFLANA